MNRLDDSGAAVTIGLFDWLTRMACGKPSSNPQSVPLLGARGINTILGFSFKSPTIEETRLRRDEYFAGAATALALHSPSAR